MHVTSVPVDWTGKKKKIEISIKNDRASGRSSSKEDRPDALFIMSAASRL